MGIRTLRSLFVCAAAFLLVVALGCRGSNSNVTGKVTFNGKNLKGGTIMFMSNDTKIVKSDQIALNGSYKIADLPSGDYKVTVETETLKPFKMPAGAGPPKGVELPDYMKGSGDEKRYVPIPTKYASMATSGLTFKAKGGDQTFNIPLK